MKKHLLVFLFTLFGFLGMAQTPTNQDCLGAIPVCQKVFIQPNAYAGTGNYLNEITPALSCLNQGEKNDVWYVFTVQNPGNLSFTIFTNLGSDDYDWALFNLTNATCADIAINPSLQVSCNFSGVPGNTGMNGLPGAQNNPTIPVLAGQTYVLNISNFTSNQSGYTLNFSASTAVIFDTIPPVMQAFSAVQCKDDSLVVTFSENVLCQSVQLSDFTFINPSGNPINMTSISSSACVSGADYYNTYVIKFSPALSLSGVYTLNLVDTVLDACSNVAIFPASLSVTVTGTNVSLTSTNIDCGTGTPGTATVSNVTGGTGPFTYLWSNGQTSTTATGLNNGTYSVTVTPAVGCPAVASAIITSSGTFVSQITGDPIICENKNTILDCGVSGATYSWSLNGNATGGNTQTLTASAAGIYQVNITNQVGCTSTASFTVAVENLLPAPVVKCLPAPNGQAGFVYIWNSIPGANGYAIQINGGAFGPPNGSGDTSHTVTTAASSVIVHALGNICGAGNNSMDAYCEIVIPNIVTPNGDGKNDVFNIKNLEQYSNAKLEIFDRWGKSIYTSDEYKNDYNFKNIPDGVYYYLLTVPDKPTYNGTVTVLR